MVIATEHLPLLQEVILEGPHAELVWNAALPSFIDRNVHLQLQLASICAKENRKVVAHINAHFSACLKRQIHPASILEIVESEFVQLGTLWNAIKPHINDQKIVKAFIPRIAKSSNYKLSIGIAAEIGEAAAAVLHRQIEKMIHSEGVPLDQIWDVVKSLPNHLASIHAFFQRLAKSTDLKLNFKLLAQALEIFHPPFLENKPSLLFNH